ncbi:MAG TPA: Ig-like domain-containing protein [Acidobacteriota bacterium]|nr:Ig-like domain-containing protein [Acidobacteriota bacterium]
MNRTARIALSAIVLLIGTTAQAANHVTVESKSVAPGATGVQVGVYIDNDLELNGLVVPLEIREITTNGTFITGTLSIDAANRLTVSLIGFVVKNYYATPDNTNPSFCGGGGYATPGLADFVSPDAILFSTVSTSDPCLSVGSDGTPPGGSPSLYISFDVTASDGIFTIDTTCTTPDNHLLYVDCLTSQPATPTFTLGTITVGNPVFPPVVDDIPDQTIDEGGAFTAIALDDFVFDPDHDDDELSWIATGQSGLIVNIGPGRVATVTTSNPDWFGVETITFTATDPDLAAGSDIAVFTVNPINDPPVLVPIGAKTVLAGDPLTFAVTGTDVDNTTLSLVMEDAPPAASFTSDGFGNGTFSWSTTCIDDGVYMVTFIVSDGLLADTGTATITVQPNPDYFAVDPETLEFTCEIAGDPPLPQTVAITDPGCGELAWTAIGSEAWLIVAPGTGSTPVEIVVSVDKTGLTVGDYYAVVTIAEPTPEKDVAVEIAVPVHLNVVELLCYCPCAADPVCDGVTNVLDPVMAIAVLFRGQYTPIQDEFCPTTRIDVNCDNRENVLDIVLLIEVAFRDRDPAGLFCDPCDQ